MGWPTWLRWPGRRARAVSLPDVPEAVSPAQTEELAAAQQQLEDRKREFAEKLPEIRRVTRVLGRAQEINHLAERFRKAFGLGGEASGYSR